MCLKDNDFNGPIVVESAITPASVSVQAFPLVDHRDDQLVQLVDGSVVEAPSDPSSGAICRGQVNFSNVKSYLIEIINLCHDVERSLTASFKIWKAEERIPDLDQISNDVFSHSISLGPVVRCFEGDPPDPIVKTAEVISVRIERKLSGRLSDSGKLDWFMIKIVQAIRATFRQKNHSDVVVIFYDSIFDLDPAKRQNDLVLVDLNVQNGSISAEKKALVKHLEAFFGEQRVSQALRPLNPAFRAEQNRLPSPADTHGTLEAGFIHKQMGATERAHHGAASVTSNIGGEMRIQRNGKYKDGLTSLQVFKLGYWTMVLGLFCAVAFLALGSMSLALAASVVASVGGVALMFAALGDQAGEYTRES